MLKVKKRDGRIVPFKNQKIVNAILAAFNKVEGGINEYAKEKASNIANYIEGYYEDCENEIAEIEDIQDLVEKGLMSCKKKDVAKEYILYREERSKIRNQKTQLSKAITEKLLAKNVQNSNANMDENSFGGRKGEAANTLLKQYALDYCMSEMARNNHINNEIYIHDLDSYILRRT